MKQRIAIIGGGISGLTAAYVLHRDYAGACDVTLFEASTRLGGIVETVRSNGFTIECGPDSWVTEKPWAEKLARELGLAEEILSSNDIEPRTYIAHAGSIIPLPAAMRMMVPTDLEAVRASRLFTEAAKQAYEAEPLRAAELRDMALLHRGPDTDESVAEFVRRHFGNEVVHTVAGPLLAGIFGGDIEKLSARSLLGPFIALEAQHGSLIAGLQAAHRSTAPVFTTLATGLGTLIDRLQRSLPPASIRLSRPVLALHPLPTGWAVETSSDSEQFDRILVATSLDTTRQLLASLPMPEAKRAAALLPTNAASGLVVALGCIAHAQPATVIPPGFGFLVANPSGNHNLLACTFVHQKFPRRAPPGTILLRAFFASSAADRLSQQSDEEIAVIAREQLTQFLGPLPEHAEITIVRRWPRSLPQYDVGHLARIAQFKTCLESLPRLAVAGNALRGVGLPDLIRDAMQAAHGLIHS